MAAFALLASVINTAPLPTVQGNQSTVDTILNITFSILGSIAVLMIVIGGLRYIIAHGDPGATAKAKNSIIYAVIGLVIAMTAYGIVNFTIRNVI